MAFRPLKLRDRLMGRINDFESFDLGSNPSSSDMRYLIKEYWWELICPLLIMILAHIWVLVILAVILIVYLLI